MDFGKELMVWYSCTAVYMKCSLPELPCLPTVMCTMHRHQTYIKSIPNEQSTSILCAIDGKLTEFGYLTFQFSVTMAMMPCSLRVMGDSSAGVAQLPQELRSSNINQAKSTSCRLLYTSTRPLAPFQSPPFTLQ